MKGFTAEREGERLDVFLARLEPSLSRTHIQKLIADGCISVSGRAEKPKYKLRAGDLVTFDLPEPEEADVSPQDIPLDILYEDRDVIVINKARGMVVHPAAGTRDGTLVNALLSHCRDLSGINGKIRPGIVHRLDKDTSGVMIAAKNDKAHISLADQIRTKTASRIYIAIVLGNILESEGVIHAPIGRSDKDRKKMAVVRENGKDATTRFRVLERFGGYTLVECRLLTGRTHQIRVHMEYIGHPVACDPRYGGRPGIFPIRGQALHSLSLSFSHPSTGERMRYTAPLPSDMRDIIDMLRDKTRLEAD